MAIISRPRNIPVVSALLDDTAQVRTAPGHRSSIVMGEIFSNDLLSTDTTAAGPGIELKQSLDGEKIIFPKFLVETTDALATGVGGVVALGPYVILAPRLRRTTNLLLADASNNDVLPGALASYGVAVWKPSKTYDATSFRGISNTNYDIEKYAVSTSSEFDHTLYSNFLLLKNQPFMVRVDFTGSSASLENTIEFKLNDTTYTTANKWCQMLDVKNRKDGGCIISFGNYRLVVYRTASQAVLYEASGTAGKYTKLGTAAGTASFGDYITIYPIDKTLYICRGQGLPDDNRHMATRQMAVTPIITDKKIAYSGKLSLKFWGPKAVFKFCPIIHTSYALVTSPSMQFSAPSNVITDYMSVSCAGKKVKQTGSSPVTITFGIKDTDYPEYFDAATGNGYIAAEVTSKDYYSDKKKTKKYITLSLTAGNVAGAGTSKASTYSWVSLPTTYYSPAVNRIDYTVEIAPVTVALQPNPQIDNGDILSVTVHETAENSSCELVLNNRIAAPQRRTLQYGKYTYRPDATNKTLNLIETASTGNNNFCGVKPITVKFGYKGESTEALPINKFSGYVINRQYQRSGSATSTVTLVCQDKTKRLRETPSFMLPIYDGWCHLAVIYDLAKFAGLTDDEILIYQDPLTGGNILRLCDLMDIDASTNRGTKSGGCYDGHAVNEFPKGLPGNYLGAELPGCVIHAKVSTTPEKLSVEPLWMFTKGAFIWDCMLRVREESRWILCTNAFGNLIYCPTEYYLAQSETLTFREMPTQPGDFDEIQEHLNVTQSTEQMVNGVIVMGLVPVVDGAPNVTPLMPQMERVVNEKWPNNINDPNYYPWMKFIFKCEPMMSDPIRLSAYAHRLYRNNTRNMRTVSFATWGNPHVHVHQIIRVIERSGETGASGSTPDEGALYIVTSVTHTLETTRYMYTTTIDAELYEPGVYQFSALPE